MSKTTPIRNKSKVRVGPPPPPRAAMIPVNVLGGRYQLKRRLGAGGMAQVFLAVDMQLGREVAIKMLRPELCGDAYHVSRFRNEAMLLARVESDRVVQIHDMHFSEEHSYLVLRRIAGSTLDRTVARLGAFAPVATLQLACDVLDGLCDLHLKHIIHRDIKPSNVVMDNDERALLLDLGVASDRREEGLTPAYHTAGTPAYMAPEQRETGHVDVRCDIYQVGLLMIYAATGIDPTQFDTNIDAILEGMSPRVAKIAKRAISRNPEHRFQTAAEMRIEAQRAAREQDTQNLSIIDLHIGAPIVAPPVVARAIEVVSAPQALPPDRFAAATFAPEMFAADTFAPDMFAPLTPPPRPARKRTPYLQAGGLAGGLAAAIAICAMGFEARQTAAADVPQVNAVAVSTTPHVFPEFEQTVTENAPKMVLATAAVRTSRPVIRTARAAPVEAELEFAVAPTVRPTAKLPTTAEDYLRAANTARKNGANEAAIAGYRQYLRLSTDAETSIVVRARLTALENGRYDL